MKMILKNMQSIQETSLGALYYVMACYVIVCSVMFIRPHSSFFFLISHDILLLLLLHFYRHFVTTPTPFSQRLLPHHSYSFLTTTNHLSYSFLTTTHHLTSPTPFSPSLRLCRLFYSFLTTTPTHFSPPLLILPHHLLQRR